MAGGVFALLFTAAFVDFCIEAFRVIAEYYRMGFEFEIYTPEPIHLERMLLPFLAALLVYAANVIDATAAGIRLARKQNQPPEPQ